MRVARGTQSRIADRVLAAAGGFSMVPASERRGEYRRDRLSQCPAHGCRARPGKPCKKLPPRRVHFGRRLARILDEQEYRRDLEVACPSCRARAGEPCRGLLRLMVHAKRRFSRELDNG